MHKSGREAVILLRIIYAGLDADVFKSAVGLLVIERVTLSRQSARSAHYGDTTELAKILTYTPRLGRVGRVWRQIVEIYLNVSRHKQIQTAIAIVITPRGARAPPFASHP